MALLSATVAASPDVNGGQSASTSDSETNIGTTLAIPLSAALQPTVTRARTPRGVTSSAWKPFTAPIACNDELKWASLPTATNTAKRSRISSSQAANDLTDHSAAGFNSNDVSDGKRGGNLNFMRQDGQLNDAIIALPLKSCTDKSSSNVLTKRKSMTARHSSQLTASMKKLQTENGDDSSNVFLTKVTSASTNDSGQLAAVVSLPALDHHAEHGQNSNTLTAVFSSTSQVDQLAAPVISLPMQNLQSSNQMEYSNVPTETSYTSTGQYNLLPSALVTSSMQKMETDKGNNFTSTLRKATSRSIIQVGRATVPAISLPMQELQAVHGKNSLDALAKATHMTSNEGSGLAAAAAAVPLPGPKLQRRNIKDSSNMLSTDAQMRALLVKRQEQLLQQVKSLGPSKQHHIKGPALSLSEGPPLIVPLGTRCQLCRLDLAFRPQGDAGRSAAALPVVVVLPCHHAFHHSCIEAVYGLAEPSQCISCHDSGTAP